MKGFGPVQLPIRRYAPFLLTRASLLVACLLLTGASCRSKSETFLPLAWLEVGGKRIQVEVADTPPTQRSGLMFRKELGKDQGMLFVFDREEPRSFWMKNTYLPLSIAFIDKKGVILNILEMEPQTLSNHPSKGPAQYALEMNSGWFTRLGIKPGDKVLGLPGKTSPAPSAK